MCIRDRQTCSEISFASCTTPVLWQRCSVFLSETRPVGVWLEASSHCIDDELHAPKTKIQSTTRNASVQQRVSTQIRTGLEHDVHVQRLRHQVRELMATVCDCSSSSNALGGTGRCAEREAI
eukprot:358181-Pleurochrysis_carterae.AAC.3